MAVSPDDLGFSRSLAAAIVARRIEKEMTQEGVARAIDVPLSVYRSWERERATPRGAAFYRLCLLFDWPHVLRPSMEASEPNLCSAQLVPDQAVWVIAPPAETASTVISLNAAADNRDRHDARRSPAARSRTRVAA